MHHLVITKGGKNRQKKDWGIAVLIHNQGLLRLILVACVLAFLSGCATGRGLYDVPPNDPMEGFNRGMYKFTRGVDRFTLRPLAKGYDFITPQPIQNGIGNFFDNLQTPRYAINNFLQGKIGRGFGQLGRFVLNSIMGIGGIMDPSTHLAEGEWSDVFARQNEGFGDTLAVWGMKPGAYLFIPFIGPSSPRDGIGFIADYQLDILTHYNRSKYRDKLMILKIIHQRASLLDYEETLAQQEDEYVFVRNAWMQNRNFRVMDGEIAEDDVDDSEFGDEFD